MSYFAPSRLLRETIRHVVSGMASAIIVLLWALQAGAQGQDAFEQHRKDFASWEPRFRQAWSSDQCVQNQQQDWADYYSHWVTTFFFQPGNGWFEQTDALLAKVGDASKRAALRRRLNELGVRIGAEWSKDNSCRRIDTFGANGIIRIGSALNAAVAADSGDGQRITEAVSAVEKQVSAALGSP